MTVSNTVLNSVVTLRTSITSALLMRFATGSAGVDSETYLLPKIVVASMSPRTFAGISLTYLGSTSSVNFAASLPSATAGSIAFTRPMATPL